MAKRNFGKQPLQYLLQVNCIQYDLQGGDGYRLMLKQKSRRHRICLVPVIFVKVEALLICSLLAGQGWALGPCSP